MTGNVNKKTGKNKRERGGRDKGGKERNTEGGRKGEELL